MRHSHLISVEIDKFYLPENLSLWQKLDYFVGKNKKINTKNKNSEQYY